MEANDDSSANLFGTRPKDFEMISYSTAKQSVPVRSMIVYATGFAPLPRWTRVKHWIRRLIGRRPR